MCVGGSLLAPGVLKSTPPPSRLLMGVICRVSNSEPLFLYPRAPKETFFTQAVPLHLFPKRKRLKDGVQGPSHPETLCGSNRKGLPVQSCLDYCPFSSSFLSQMAGKTHDRVTSPRANLSFCSASHWYPRALQWTLTETHTHQLMQLNTKKVTQFKKG